MDRLGRCLVLRPTVLVGCHGVMSLPKSQDLEAWTPGCVSPSSQPVLMETKLILAACASQTPKPVRKAAAKGTRITGGVQARVMGQG